MSTPLRNQPPYRGIHPIAELFPMLADDELEELAADIAEHGLHQPIMLDTEANVLDGRNRLEACRRAGVKPEFDIYYGEPVAFIVSANLKRRHLTASQRAMIADRLATLQRGRPSENAQNCAISSQAAAATMAEVLERIASDDSSHAAG